MKYNICTLFDKNYLYRGLALYESTLKHCHDFKLWILCMDDTTFDVLDKLNLGNVELIKLSKIENEKLISVKAGRNAGEYSWTCKPHLINYILEQNKELDSMLYLDSDFFFFSSPEPIYTELEGSNIGITPHRFIDNKDELERKRGKYNAGFVYFKNCEESFKCLKWWSERCIEWCFHRLEDGKLGDQLYLNDWTQRFEGVHAIQNKGVNLGPWNISQYEIKNDQDAILVDEDRLILFHVHSLKIYSGSNYQIANEGYGISTQNKKFIYEPYLNTLDIVIKKVNEIDKNFSFGFFPKPDFYTLLKSMLKRFLKG